MVRQANLRGKPDAGNPHVRFDEGEVASAKPRRGSLLYTAINSVSHRLGALLGCLWGVWAGEAAVFQSGTNFAEGTWDEAPAAGGGAELSIEIGAAAPWSVANDLGVDGWLTLNQLTTLTAGRLSGTDGLAFVPNGEMAAGWQMAGEVTCEAPLKVDGELTVSSAVAGSRLEIRNDISGTGDLRVVAPKSYVGMWGRYLGSGDIHVDLGELQVNSQEALGSATVYVQEESTRDVVKRVRIDCPSGEMTITNSFVLGTEDTANWQARLWVKGGGVIGQGGTVYLTGPITSSRAKFACDYAAVTHVRGGVTGDKFVLQPSWDSAIYVEETPLSLTGEFWVGGGGAVHLNARGSTYTSLYGFGATRLVCGAENILVATANFASQDNPDSNVHVDLNGFDQEIGAFNGMEHEARPFTFMNSKTGTTPTITINQSVSSSSPNLFFEGTLNVVKQGRGVLTWAHGVLGDLTIREGNVYVNRDIPEFMAETITVERGGILDLGGNTVHCRKLVVRNGGVVHLGTIEFEESELESGASVSASLVGPVTKRDDGTLYLMNDAVVGSSVKYELPEGTAVYFPFDDSLEAACRDRSGYAVQLVLNAGDMPTYCDEGRSGGCLYFNGNSSLKAVAFPQSIHLGDAPYTAATWVKIDEGCGGSGGWLGYGTTSAGRCNNFRLNWSMNSIWNYWWDRDVGCGMPNGGTFGDRQWHYVVGTYDGAGERRIYVDGVRMKTNTDYRLNLASGSFIVGKTLGDACMKGWIDDVLIVNRALSGDEIAALYAQGGVKRTMQMTELRVDGGEVMSANDSVVCCYHFDSSETLLDDASGNGISLVCGRGNTNVMFSEDTPRGEGGSLYLDGSSYLTTALFPEKMPVGNQPRSIACFLKMASGCPGEGAFVSWGSGTSGNYRYCNVALREGGNKLALSPWGYDDHRVSVGYGNLLNAWHSFVVTWDGQRLTYFLDGNQVGDPKEYAFAFNTLAQDFRIGWAYYDASYFKGNLDDVTIWNRAISPAEVVAFHHRGVSRNGMMASGTRLTVTGNGVVSLGANQQTTLSGLSGDGAVNGDVTLADGAEIATANGGPAAIHGTLTIAGGGTVVLPETCSESYAVYPLFAPETLDGADNLAAWSFVNVPDGKHGRMRVRNGVVEAVVGAAGMSVLIR